MKQFVHTAKVPLGIHVRPAGMITKLAKAYSDTAITVSCNGKEAKASALMKLMGLGIRKGDRITVVTEGAHEDAAIIAISDFFQNHL